MRSNLVTSFGDKAFCNRGNVLCILIFPNANDNEENENKTSISGYD